MMRTIFRASLVAVAVLLVVALLIGTDPAWLNGVWTLALVGLIVSGVALLVGRFRRV